MNPKILWIGPTAVPSNVLEAVRGKWDLCMGSMDKALQPQLSQGDIRLAMVSCNGMKTPDAWFNSILAQLTSTSAVALFLTPDENGQAHMAEDIGPVAALWSKRDASPVEITTKLEAASALQPIINSLKDALASGVAAELNEEMKIAARLQRDFMPSKLPEVGKARFSVLFQPAGFVSGDLYDVVRLDETHVGFYVADAVGHGLPAALLTMFIKKALQVKRITNNSYEIISPEISLAELNSSICQQDLSSCQFCTAIYCVLDTVSLELTYARAGHPEALLLHQQGPKELLGAEGGLLGIFADATFTPATVQLAPGDRLIVYTDGAELHDDREDVDGNAELLEFLSTLGSLSREEMMGRLTEWVQNVRHNSREQDDVTALILDIEND